MLFVASAEAQFLVWWIWYLLSFLLWIHFTEKDLLCTAALPDDSIVMTSKKSKFFEKITSNSVEFWKMIQKDTFPYKLTLFDYFSFHCSHDPHIQIQLFFYSIWFLNVKFYLVETFEKKDKKLTKNAKEVNICWIVASGKAVGLLLFGTSKKIHLNKTNANVVNATSFLNWFIFQNIIFFAVKKSENEEWNSNRSIFKFFFYELSY